MNGAVLQVPERGVDHRDRGQVAPVQVLEHEQHRLRRALGAQEVLPGEAQLIAHEHRVAPRRPELHVVLVRERRADELAEERRDPRGVERRVPLDPRPHLAPPPSTGSAPVDAPIALPERVREQAEGRAGAHRIPLAEPHLDRLAVAPGARGGARGAGATCPCRPAPSPAPRSGSPPRCSGRARPEQRELPLAPDARRRLAEQRGAAPSASSRAPWSQGAPPVGRDVEPRAEQPRRHLVDADRGRAGASRGPRGAAGPRGR